MKNIILFLLSCLMILGAISIRLSFIEGTVGDVIFSNNIPYESLVTIFSENTYAFLLQAYHESIDAFGYLSGLIIFTSFMRLLFFVYDISLSKSMRIKSNLADSVKLIRDSVTDFKSQSSLVKDYYEKNGIKTSHIFLIILLKIALVLITFSLVRACIDSEPSNLQDYRLQINMCLGMFLFPLFIYSKGEIKGKEFSFYSIALPSILYVFSLFYFSVSLMLFIIVMQSFNWLSNFTEKQLSSRKIESLVYD